VAEEAGLIAQIGHWTLRESALQQQAWHRQGLLPMRMSVNVSTLQFHQANFVDTVRGALNDSGIDPQLFEIEVTESVLVRDHNLARRTLFRLEHLGVRTALDDFGTGYSSLAYLQRLPISSLKIDRSFVKGLVPPEVNVTGTSSVRGSQVRPVRAPHAAEPVVSTVGERGVVGAAPIVEAICAMAHKLGKEVIAEGIETAYQRDYLRRLGVDLAQGYFFARPLSPLQAEELLRRVTQESLAEERRRRAAASWTAAPHLAPTPRPAAPRASAPPPVAPPPARRDSEPTALDELLLWER